MAKKMLPKRFNEEDIKLWQKAADKDNRNLSNWMETVLNEAAKKQLETTKMKGK